MQMTAMFLTDGIDDNHSIPLRCIFCAVFQFLSLGATHRLLIKADKQRKRLEEYDYGESLAFDLEKQH